MSTGEESFVPVEEAEVKSAMPNEGLDTPTKASSMKEGAEDSTPSGNRFPLPDQAKSSQATYVFKPDKPKMGGAWSVQDEKTGHHGWAESPRSIGPNLRTARIFTSTPVNSDPQVQDLHRRAKGIGWLQWNPS